MGKTLRTTDEQYPSEDIPAKLPPPEVTLEEPRSEKPDETEEDPFLVKFAPGDPRDPKNWSRIRRWYLTLASGLLVLNATFASAAPTGIVVPLQTELRMSEMEVTLMISLFLAGYCVGPLLWGPLSEQCGRRPVFVYTFAIYTIFQVATAVSRNTASLLVFRFLGGTFAAAPLTNSGALISDIWDANTRGKALAIFTLAPFAGPALGPTIAGFIAESVSWRWLFWVLSIFAGVCLVLIVFTMPETYAPVLLIKAAKEKRKSTKDDRYYAPMEREEAEFLQLVEKVVAKPFKILFQEPMLIAMTIYMSFVYGCLYLLFEAYPVVFTEGHGFSAGISGLTFLPIPLGGAIAVYLYVQVYNPRYEAEARRLSPNPVPPEFRLTLALIAGPIYSVSFFWFGWTSFPSVSFWAPMMAGLPMGLSICWIFLSLFNYIIDAYLSVAASALAANTVVRSLCGAGFPLFATRMYVVLNPRWASTILGLIAVLMIPIPLVLAKYGPILRQRSKHAPKHALKAVGALAPV
ncbi:MFS general substrate transporter [Pluteus cervinus]|uniref:MFS general substrate transporter n=1 Tax=Pluteus cervinus TaxID=181527 RepID=A0ACD3BG88_9AGAR|nr:MFS general substrate transporter [Pluteus cervinus]